MTKNLPYYKVSGNYEKVGEFLGNTFRDKITQRIKERRRSIPNYESYLTKSQKCLDITRYFFPHLMKETTEIAKAAGIPLVEYFFMNNREVFDEAEAHDKKHSANIDHCTVVAGFDKGKLVIGHNEDWSISALSEICILEIEIENIAFIGLNYMSVIPGSAASLNNAGLVQCINDIYQTAQIGVPKNYVARAILETKSLDEAERLIRNTNKASGFNHVLACGNEIRNIEIAGDKLGIQNIINEPYVHTNHYLTNELKPLEKFHTKSSDARYERAYSLLTTNMTDEDIKRILSDTNDNEYPICRENETIGSAIFIPSELQASFCYGHPCKGTYISYNLY
ncbi:hypothetical protein IPM62_00545 [Candidatus Woesebacteria bacterium]|nr:MAG: hypothetical protein IPM62_00545 [Candidatus Woesebacteria bacterium]